MEKIKEKDLIMIVVGERRGLKMGVLLKGFTPKTSQKIPVLAEE